MVEEEICGQFLREGYVNLGSIIPIQDCQRLYDGIKHVQKFSSDLFLDEETFLKNPQFKNVNPVPGRNILERFENEIRDIEANPEVVGALDSVLGNNYEILNKKLICGVPERWIPNWVLKRIKENPVNNLGAYIKPEFRHITYFYGIDFHQDIIDWSGREPDFITLYIYLHDVEPDAAPLNLLPRSHRLGVDKFPHMLTLTDTENREWTLRNQVNGGVSVANQLTVLGGPGNVAFWHSYTIHGTKPNIGVMERISLRYLIAKNPDCSDSCLDMTNSKVNTTLFDQEMRTDLLGDGQPNLKKNYLYEQQKSRR